MLVQLRHIRLFFEKSADGPGLWIQFPGPLQKKAMAHDRFPGSNIKKPNPQLQRDYRHICHWMSLAI